MIRTCIILKLLIFLVVFFPFTVFASSTTFYISPSGNDTNSGSSSTAPWKTFPKAWSVLMPGDTLLLLDGTYTAASSAGIETNAIIYPTINGLPGQYITIKALNDGKAIIDGQYAIIPIRIGQAWTTEDPNPSNTNPANTPSNPFGNYFRIEGLVAKNSSGTVIIISARNVIARRNSAYNANPDTNANAISVYAQGDIANPSNILIEDNVAAGSGRKMLLAYDTYNNVIFRRNFAAWQWWRGANACQAYWPQTSGIELYPARYKNQPDIATNSIMENNINFGLLPESGISFSPNPGDLNGNPERIGNKILGSISLGTGMRWDNTTKQFVSAVYTVSGNNCTYNNMPKPANCPTSSCLYTDAFSGFSVGPSENPYLKDNLFQDIFAAYNGNVGLRTGPWNPNSTNNQLIRATLVNNGLSTSTAVNILRNVDSTSSDLARFSAVSDIKAGSILGGTNPSPGTGAKLQNRYENGVLTEEPLWPWPMEERIKAEFANPDLFQANGIHGQVWTDFSVTREICTGMLLPNGAVTTCNPTTATPGDADRNGSVNILDYQILANTFGSTTDLRANFNTDSVVNILDYQILANNFGIL